VLGLIWAEKLIHVLQLQSHVKCCAEGQHDDEGHKEIAQTLDVELLLKLGDALLSFALPPENRIRFHSHGAGVFTRQLDRVEVVFQHAEDHDRGKPHQ